MTIDSVSISVAQSPPIVAVFSGDNQPVVVVEQTSALVVTLPAEQGPAGPPGPSGPPGSAVQEVMAAAVVNGHRCLVGTSMGAMHASADVSVHAVAILGIALGASASGGNVQVHNAGPLIHSGWNWTPGPVLLGLDGNLTQNPPTGAQFVLTLGYGDGQTLVVNIGSPIYLE